MDYPVILHVLSFSSEDLHRLVSKSLSEYCRGLKKPSSRKLPISLLISTNIYREYPAIIFSLQFRSIICTLSARLGNLSAIQWARSQDCSWESRLSSFGPKRKSMTKVQCPWNEDTCSAAAEHAQLTMLQWLRSQGWPWNSKSCSSAASNGHLDLLQWLRSQGCPWDEDTCSYAAENGHLDVLQWARSQGCMWNENTCLWPHIMVIWKCYNG